MKATACTMVAMGLVTAVLTGTAQADPRQSGQPGYGATTVTVITDNGTTAVLGNLGGHLGDTPAGGRLTGAGNALTGVGIARATYNGYQNGGATGAITAGAYETGVSVVCGRVGQTVGGFVGGVPGAIVGGAAAHGAQRAINGLYSWATTPYPFPAGWQPPTGPATPPSVVSYWGPAHRSRNRRPVRVTIDATDPRYVHTTRDPGAPDPITVQIGPHTPRRPQSRQPVFVTIDGRNPNYTHVTRDPGAPGPRTIEITPTRNYRPTTYRSLPTRNLPTRTPRCNTRGSCGR